MTDATEKQFTPKQAAFVREYLVDLNAAQAAVRAGYSRKYAFKQGHRLLTDEFPHVQAAIERAMRARAQRVQLKGDAVLRELALLCRSDVTDYVVGDDGRLTVREGRPRAAMRAVASVKHTRRTDKDGHTTETVEYRLWDKPSALNMAGRHLSLWNDKLTITLKDLENASEEDLARLAGADE